ncbi:MAG: cobalamin biosynthesis protein [Deltaproteobacteria bacterium]|nr:cobalamin biosynthesis protein [Deltaproteobacteria bacterium]
MSGKDRLPYAVYSITRHGVAHGAKLAQALPGAHWYVAEKFLTEAGVLVPAGAPWAPRPLPFPLAGPLAQAWGRYHAHIMVVSVGAAVRLTAPLLADKKTDPAVVCVDDAARFAVCLLSGHIGRGNEYTRRTAEVLGAQAVITTASDALGTLAADILGREFGWMLDDLEQNVTQACAVMVNGQPAALAQETGEPGWWPADKPLPDNLRVFSRLEEIPLESVEMVLAVTDRLIEQTLPDLWKKSVVYRPKSLVLGIGCDKNTPPELVRRGVEKILREQGLSAKSVKTLATIDLKQDEPAVVELARSQGWPLVVYPAAELDRVEGMENPSETVRKHTGTRGVAEPACLLASGATKLLVPKQSYTEDGAGRSMTLAVARIPFPKNPWVK